jgi:hypothetical protein
MKNSGEGEFHDQGGAEWTIIRGQLRDHNDTPWEWPTPGRPISRLRVGRPQGVFGGFSYSWSVISFSSIVPLIMEFTFDRVKPLNQSMWLVKWLVLQHWDVWRLWKFTLILTWNVTKNFKTNHLWGKGLISLLYFDNRHGCFHYVITSFEFVPFFRWQNVFV